MENTSREKSLFKNTAIISIGTICTKLITFFLLPLYTGVLSTDQYGVIDLLNTLIILLIPIVTFQVEQAVFRELIENRNNEFEKGKIISSGIYSVLFQCLIFSLIYIVFSIFINNQFSLILLLCLISNILSSLLLQISRGLGNNLNYSIASFVGAVLTIGFSIIFLLIFKLNVFGVLFATIIGYLSMTLYLYISLNLHRYLSFKNFSKESVKRMWKYSLPLIPNAISWWIVSSSDKLIVSTFLGLTMNGILAAASKFSNIYIVLYNIFNLSITESISLHIDDKDINEFFNKVFSNVLNLFICISFAFISIIPFVFPIMVNVRYMEGYYLVPILIIGSLFNVFVGLISTIYVAKKNTKAIANTSLLSAIINIVTHVVLINFIGVYAAAISTLVAYFFMGMYRQYDTVSYTHLTLPTKA